MANSAWQATIQDNSGNIVEGAEVQVLFESSGTPATIYSDRAGTPLVNPFLTGSTGFAQFYAPAGNYRVVATKGAFTNTWRDQRLGESQGYDVQSSASDFTSGLVVTTDSVDVNGGEVVTKNGGYLGNSATKTVQTSGSDFTAGRVALTEGLSYVDPRQFGLGQFSFPNDLILVTDVAVNTRPTGFYRYSSAAANTPDGVSGNLTQITRSSTSITFFAINDNNDAFTAFWGGAGPILWSPVLTGAATETQIGGVEKATSAEMTAGTADKYPDASTVKEFAVSKNDFYVFLVADNGTLTGAPAGWSGSRVDNVYTITHNENNSNIRPIGKFFRDAYDAHNLTAPGANSFSYNVFVSYNGNAASGEHVLMVGDISNL